MDEQLFHGNLVKSKRILYTASLFAKRNLIYLQEVGELYALKQHISRREQLKSYLFFIVLDGNGTLQYEETSYAIKKGDCVFIDCKKKYSHKSSKDHLWHLKWVHFYGPTMESIYEEYLSQGGRPYFLTKELDNYSLLLQEIFSISNLDYNVRDMMIFEKLAGLLTLIMAENYRNETISTEMASIKAKLLDIKNHLDKHYAEKVSLSSLEHSFYINKYYLSRIFKENFGISVNNYLIQKRITEAKYLLRFTNKTIEEISCNCGISDTSYFNRLFKKLEGITPGEFRKLWSISE
jgi:AraC-like DNA-binding protein